MKPEITLKNHYDLFSEQNLNRLLMWIFLHERNVFHELGRFFFHIF